MIPRFFYGFLFALGAGVLLIDAVRWFTASSHYSFYASVEPLVLLFVYGTAAVIGIPAFLLYHRFGLNRWWHYALGGSLIGLVAPLLLVALLGASPFTSPNLFVPMAYYAAIGIASALAFWVIVIWNRHQAEV